MFDWDRDYDNLVAAAATRDKGARANPDAPPPWAARPPLRMPMRVLWSLAASALVLVAALMVAGQVRPAPGPETALAPDPEAAQLDTDAPAAQAQPAASPAPVALLAYRPADAARFRRGLGRFSDDDLLIYAQQTRHMLANPDDPLAPFLADALALTEAETRIRAQSAARARAASSGRPDDQAALRGPVPDGP